jgi:ubiquinone biosynthesis protein
VPVHGDIGEPRQLEGTSGVFIGASLLMRVVTLFQLFGYPGLAILCFIAAASFWLVIGTFIADYKGRKKYKR